MPHVTKFIAVSLFAALGLTAGTAQAAPVSPGWYLGVDAGRSELKPERGSDVSDTAFAVHGGYRITRHFAIEAGYADLGDFSYRQDCPAVCIPEDFPQHVNASVERLDVGLLGSVPLGERAEVYARAGVAQTQVDATLTSPLGGSRSRSSDSSDTVYGLGLRVHLDAPWSLRLQWERGSADVGLVSADLDALWLGAEYRFARQVADQP